MRGSRFGQENLLNIGKILETICSLCAEDKRTPIHTVQSCLLKRCISSELPSGSRIHVHRQNETDFDSVKKHNIIRWVDQGFLFESLLSVIMAP
jgi:hypothetical protein